MKFFILLLATIVAAAPPADDDEIVITKNFYPDRSVIYSGKHDIVEIVVPLNEINFTEDTKGIDESRGTIFFVEADIKDNGKKDYKGLYVYKNHVATKVLENGQCVTYAKKDIAYFGAKDGIYKYNSKDKTATKYGTVTDSVIKMTFDTKKARVYYLTENYVLHKYNEDEVESAKVDAVKDARDIVFDFDGNLFYYDGNNQFYTYNGERVLKIEGLPANPTKVDLIRAPVLRDKVSTVIDDRLYEIMVNGSSERTPVKFLSKPTAYAPDILTFQFFAYKQKIYLYTRVQLFHDKNIEELSASMREDEEQLNTIKNSEVSKKL